MVLPGEGTIANISYRQALREMDGVTTTCPDCKRLTSRCLCLRDRPERLYKVGCTTPKSVEYAYSKGPGMQNPPATTVTPSVFSGSRSVIFPTELRPEDKVELSCRTPPPSHSLPYRASLSGQVSELAAPLLPGAQHLPSFEDFVLSLPLGKQMLSDPPEVIATLQRDYERFIVGAMSREGVVGSSTWAGEGVVRSPRPGQPGTSYKDIPRSDPPKPTYHGDIPAWGFPRDCPPPASGKSKLGKGDGPLLTGRIEASVGGSVYRSPLATPSRESMTSRGLNSRLLEGSRKVDINHSQIPHMSQTPWESTHAYRAFSLPRR